MGDRRDQASTRRYDEDIQNGETVRILPDDEEGRHGEPPALQRGTLYTPAPEPRPPAREVQPYEPTHSTQHHGGAQRSTNALPHEEAEPVPHRSSLEGPPSQNNPARSRRGPSACAIVAGTFAVLALSCALLGFATLRGGLDGLGKLGGVFPNFSFGVTPTVTINTSQQAVIDKIRSLNKLETVSYELEKVVTGKSSGPLPDFLTSDKILLVAHGEVVAGIDLSQLQPQDVTVLTSTNTVLVTMPRAQILYSKLDNDKTYVYDRQTGVFNKPDPNLESQMRQVAEQEIVKAAQEDGILAKAQTNAQQVLRTLVSGLGYKEVQFRETP